MPDLQRLVEELRVHQVELEMQNEELRRAQLELSAARDSLRLYYDAAPVGFVTLNGLGIIQEINPTAGQLLNLHPLKAPGQSLAAFLPRESRQAFAQHRQELDRT